MKTVEQQTLAAPRALPLALPPPRYTIYEYVNRLVPCPFDSDGDLPVDALLAAKAAIEAALDYWLVRDGKKYRNESPGEKQLPGECYYAKNELERTSAAEHHLFRLSMWWMERLRARRDAAKAVRSERLKRARMVKRRCSAERVFA